MPMYPRWAADRMTSAGKSFHLRTIGMRNYSFAHPLSRLVSEPRLTKGEAN